MDAGQSCCAAKNADEGQCDKLSYEQLKTVAHQAHEQAEVWRQRAYEASAKLSRIDLILSCLNMNVLYLREDNILFNAEAIESMSSELVSVLYPPAKDAD